MLCPSDVAILREDAAVTRQLETGLGILWGTGELGMLEGAEYERVLVSATLEGGGQIKSTRLCAAMIRLTARIFSQQMRPSLSSLVSRWLSARLRPTAAIASGFHRSRAGADPYRGSLEVPRMAAVRNTASCSIE